jgi:uncharacterized membrane protein YkgB
MTSNEFLQIQTIGLKIYLICFLFSKLEEMGSYSFRYIVINYFKYYYHGIFEKKWHDHYIEPMRWLTENIIYLWYLILGWGELFVLFGLLQQVRLNQVSDKSLTWFIASPMVTISIFLIIRYYESARYARQHF